MKLLCPICKTAVSSKNWRCSNGHQFIFEDDVLQLMTPSFREMLTNWLKQFNALRLPTVKSLNFETLPNSGIAVDVATWRARQQDIYIIDKLLSNEQKSVLEIGSWNGWLANYLTNKKEMEVTAIDYFVHELDGLKSKKFYAQPNWFSIQMDLEDLSVFDQKFDLIIMNRCLAYFENPIQYIKTLQTLIGPNGKIILTGLNVKKQVTMDQELIRLSEEFKKLHNRDLHFKKSRNVIDTNDLLQMKQLGFEIKLYPGLKNLIKTILKTKINTYHGVYSSSK